MAVRSEAVWPARTSPPPRARRTPEAWSLIVLAVVVWLARICRMSGVEAANWLATGTSVFRLETTVGHSGSICWK